MIKKNRDKTSLMLRMNSIKMIQKRCQLDQKKTGSVLGHLHIPIHRVARMSLVELVLFGGGKGGKEKL
jgi:hypothetical protein